MFEVKPQPPQVDEGREDCHPQQRSQEDIGLRDEEAGGLVGHGQRAGRSDSRRRSRQIYAAGCLNLT